MTQMSYAELHCISNFTFLRGASHPAELVERAKQLGYTALALTDECSLAGIVRAYAAARDAGLPLITGSEFALADGPRLVCLATSRRGYGALARLITKGRRAALKGQYRLVRKDLEEGLEDCLALWLPGAQPAAGEAVWLRERFAGRLWLAVELTAGGADHRRLESLSALARELELPVIAAGDVHMHQRRRRALQDTLTAVRLKTTVARAGHALHPNGERTLRPLQRIAKLYPREFLDATQDIAGRCHFSLDEIRYEYPEEIVPEGTTPAAHLRRLVEEGAARRWPDGTPRAVRELLERELTLIAELGYEHYFLTVHDLVAFARSRGILCQGRGSAANSAACYALGITEVDPARMTVLFERFISRERNEPPDIDVDFEHERREEVIQYLYAKYGRGRAALTATVICYRPKSAVRDVAKALGLDAPQGDRLAHAMQWWDGHEVADSRIADAGFDTENPLIARVLALTRELIGFPRHLSQHTGGFVISRGPLEELVPVENAAMPERTVIQWDKDDLDELRLLKVDVLGLGMLSAIRRALTLVSARCGREFRLQDVPAEDPAVYEMIRRADTVGVFQIESRAQMAMLPRLAPRCYYDLVIEVAIVRPGPIQGQMVHPYLRRRSGQEPVVYPGPEVQGVLERTLGVPIFQEQVMQLAIVAAGFTPGEADRLRRAMAAWKRKGSLGPFEQRLVEGMRARGYDLGFARQVFQQILGFGEYGFPECIVGETRVVDADSGRWPTIDEIVSGRARLENTLACDDQLRLRKRKVLAVVPSGVKPVWRLRTALGHTIAATAEHPFMTMGGWRQLGKLQVGDYVAVARTNGRKRGFRRFVIDRLATVLRSRELLRLSSSDVYWDKIVAIEALGAQPTYDLQIEGDHNFVANNFVVHNSHAASFALLVYVSAWLKRHEPAAFCCALLNSQPMGFYAPAQLVRDARAHGVTVLPADVNASAVESTLEDAMSGAPALRLGLDRVRGLSREGADRLVAARAEGPFHRVPELARRAQLARRDLEALAAAGALAGLAGHRHRAVWDVLGVEPPLPLVPVAECVEGLPLLRAPCEGEDIVADYRSLGFTLARHPLALLRPKLGESGWITASEVAGLPDGAAVKTGGIVVTRQRPGAAGGVIFVTLEDETGYVNLVIWSRIADAHRKVLLGARLLGVSGRLQRAGEVRHVVVDRLEDRSALLGSLAAPARNFR
jgi:DNA polymerase III alpha subunit